MKSTVLITCALSLAATMAMAADKPSVEQGKMLFSDIALGTNGKSCASCHPNGKNLKHLSDYDAKKLEAVANKCITMALKGKALDSGSPDLESLAMYMKALAVSK